MSEDRANLIAALCAQAGMIMEDVVESALTIGRVDDGGRTRRLDELKQASNRIGALIDAALALDD